MIDQPDTAFFDRYVQLWNEADATKRRATVEALWAPDGTNFTPSIEATGFDQIDARVTRSFDAWVGTGTHRFRLAKVGAHHGAATVQWEMVESATGDVASVGLEFLVLDDDGKITSDHQFVLG